VPAQDLRIPLSAAAVTAGVTIPGQVIAKLAGRAAAGTYGVVGMQDSSMRKLAAIFRGSVTEGVEVHIDEGRADIGLHVVMERGVNLAQVTANLQEQVRYQLETVCGIPVGEISVRVEDLQH
jgi:uncharacterized alkaline shock family protein YloU